jgi:DNA-binding CsgD family transcriptional regulator
MDQPNELSSREMDVVKLLLEGKSNKLIASSLHISERTVEFHLKNIFTKFQVSSRVELILKLGQSTVADKVEIAENNGRLNQWNWSASLREAVSKIGREFQMENTLNSNAHGGAIPMTFFQSILVCLKKYAEFNGRASRSEFWWFTLFILLAASAMVYISEAAGSIFLIATLLPLLAAGARRLHDIGKSGWWQLFMLVPAGGIILVGILWAMPPTSPLPDEPTPAG